MKLKNRIKKRLIELAKEKKTITYRSLGEEFGIPYEHGNTLAGLLGEISMDTYQEFGLMLSALVIRWDGIIGLGFIHLAWNEGVKGVHDPKFVEKHQRKIFKYFEKKVKHGKKKTKKL